MKIYIDLLISLNFIYDLLILITVNLTLKRNSPFKRIFLASLFGSLSTLTIFLKINNYFLLIINMILGLIMLIISFSYKNIKYFLTNFAYLYMTSVILAGFLYFLKIQFNNLAYPISLSIAPFILYLYIKEQKNLKKIVNYYKKVIITFKNNKTLELNGFLDTGNKLKDPITNKYIILVNKKSIKGIYNIRSPIYVPINTVNNHSLLPCISIKNIIVDNKVYNNYLLGISNDFKGFDNVNCLLNYHLGEG